MTQEELDKKVDEARRQLFNGDDIKSFTGFDLEKSEIAARLGFVFNDKTTRQIRALVVDAVISPDEP